VTRVLISNFGIDFTLKRETIFPKPAGAVAPLFEPAFAPHVFQPNTLSSNASRKQAEIVVPLRKIREPLLGMFRETLGKRFTAIKNHGAFFSGSGSSFGFHMGHCAASSGVLQAPS
jgi:hypothetical protein